MNEREPVVKTLWCSLFNTLYRNSNTMRTSELEYTKMMLKSLNDSFCALPGL